MNTFTFHDESEDKTYILPVSGRVARLILDDDPLDNGEYFEDIVIKEMDERGLEAEPYGIHDCSFTDPAIWGFTSYEVPTENFPKLMSIWKEILESYGVQVGEMYVKEGYVSE